MKSNVINTYVWHWLRPFSNTFNSIEHNKKISRSASCRREGLYVLCSSRWFFPIITQNRRRKKLKLYNCIISMLYCYVMHNIYISSIGCCPFILYLAFSFRSVMDISLSFCTWSSGPLCYVLSSLIFIGFFLLVVSLSLSLYLSTYK
jgi:hypothetical protein